MRERRINGVLFEIHGNYTTKQQAKTEAAYLRMQGKKAHLKSEIMPWGEIHYKVFERKEWK